MTTNHNYIICLPIHPTKYHTYRMQYILSEDNLLFPTGIFMIIM